MVKSDIISAMNANRLYWLGRYEERVYMTLHLLRKCYDKMIDGVPSDYTTFWKKLDASNSYTTNEDFTYGMMYDDQNPSSVLSAQTYAMDNAMMLRENITSETLSYLEMSLAKIKSCKADKLMNVSDLQQVTDWSLAFWGSADQRILNAKVLTLMHIGRTVEYIDMLIRFDYPYMRIYKQYEELKKFLGFFDDMADSNIMTQLDKLLVKDLYEADGIEYKTKVLKLVNILVRV